MTFPKASGRVAALLVLVGLAIGCAGGPAPREAADLTNVRLSPTWSQWLVGPVARLATPEEVQEYLALTSDRDAAEFAEGFWARRDPDPARPGNAVRSLFEERAGIADRRYAEAGYLGRRTDRGATFVLYGAPDEIQHEASRRPEGPPVEVWVYEKDREEPSLLPEPAPRWIRFVKEGDLTVRYRGPGAPGSPTRDRF